MVTNQYLYLVMILLVNFRTNHLCSVGDAKSPSFSRIGCQTCQIQKMWSSTKLNLASTLKNAKLRLGSLEKKAQYYGCFLLHAKLQFCPSL